MSAWTNIIGAIRVDTRRNNYGNEEYVKAILRNAPTITGSERNASIFVNYVDDTSKCFGTRCENCRYKYIDKFHYNQNGTAEDRSYCRKNGYECATHEVQTEVVITIEGHLRDRILATTQIEYKAFEDYIKNMGLSITTKALRITGDKCGYCEIACKDKNCETCRSCKRGMEFIQSRQ